MTKLMAIKASDAWALPVPVFQHRASWQDTWVQIEGVRILDVTETSGRSIGTAQVSFEYGSLIGLSATTYEQVNPLSILDHWVKISWLSNIGDGDFDIVVATEANLPATAFGGERALVEDVWRVFEFDGADWNNTGNQPVQNLHKWYGIVTDERRNEHSTGANLSGTQVLQCSGVEWLLTRRQIITSVVKDGAGTAIAQSGIPFNAGGGHAVGAQIIQANRKPTSSDGEDRIFTDVLTSAAPWSARDVVRYLLTHHAPTGATGPTWQLAASATDILQWYSPLNLVSHGRTVYEILNDMINWRRGLTWRLLVNDLTNIIELEVKSMLGASLVLPTGETIPEADKQWVISVYGDAVSSNVQRVTSSQKQYDQVVAVGARRGAVCTMYTTGEGQFNPDWTTTAYTNYLAGATIPAGTNLSEAKARHDAHRSQDEELSRVYTSYRVPNTWDGFVNDIHLFPVLDYYADPDAGDIHIWRGGLKVEDYIPLKEGFLYDDPTTPTKVAGTPAIPSWQSPFAAIEVVTGAKRNYCYVDRLAGHGKSEDQTPGIEFSCNLQIRDGEAGIVIRPSAPPHVLAKVVGATDYPWTTAAQGTSDHYPKADWQSAIITCYLTVADRVQVRYPSVAGSRYDATSQLIVEVPEAHLDYLSSKTVLRIAGDGTFVLPSIGAYVRDDRFLLRNVARMAFGWYETPRQAVTLTIRSIHSVMQVNEYVDSLEFSGPVNAIISSIEWDFSSGTTKIATEFAELDLGAVLNVG